MGDPTPAQTTFNLNFRANRHGEMAGIRLSLGQGGHRPSPEEELHAPFYPDPSQRMLAIVLPERAVCFVVGIEALLKLAREWGDANLEWEQWGAHAEYIWFKSNLTPWVSGPRLLSLRYESHPWAGEPWTKVYSHITRAPRSHAEPGSDRDAEHLPIVSGLRLPSNFDDCTIKFFGGGHDSLAFLMVNSSQFLNPTKSHSGVCIGWIWEWWRAAVGRGSIARVEFMNAILGRPRRFAVEGDLPVG